MRILFIFILLGCLFIPKAYSQIPFDFGFVRDNSVQVKDSSGNLQTMAWTGGLNSVHFQEMDLNLDGVLDLISFDTHGDRMLTYLNDNITDSISYTFAPQYIKMLPKCASWMQTVDYDMDGKLDIFTFVPAGIKVLRNISTATELKFTQITYMLNYFSEANFYENIFVSSVDFPSFSDVDYDGDMDILNFHVLGSFLIMYRNYSMELYGVPDSLEFKIYDKCWGKFAESENNNVVFLNQYCNYKSELELEKAPSIKHTGSTLLSINLNGDSLMDLLLGDVDFFSLNALTNGGTRQGALITSQDPEFPSYDQSIDLITFPLANYIDVDNDNVKDLIVTPFDASYYKPSNKNNVWLYKNNGITNNPTFNLSSKSFLQDRMIDIGDAASPCLVDVDGDSLLDLIIGNYGDVDSTYLDTSWYNLEIYRVSRLAYYKNFGTVGNPIYQFMESDWQGISNADLVSTHPTYGDIDGDMDADLILGSSDGQLLFYENTAGVNQPISLASPQLHFQNIDVGYFSTPQLIDINGDTLLDLVIGKKEGLVSYYQNTGTHTNPIFTLVTDTMGKINTRTHWHYYYGYSSPYFFRDQSDSLKAIVGSASGHLFYYRDIEDNILGQFGMDSNLTYLDEADTLFSVVNYTDELQMFVPFNANFRASPLVYDFNNDNYVDIMTGTYSGGLMYLKGVVPPHIGIEDNDRSTNPKLTVFPNPAREQFSVQVSEFESIKRINISIHDLSGRILFDEDFASSESTKVSCKDLPRGVYLVRTRLYDLKNNIHVSTNKLIKI